MFDAILIKMLMIGVASFMCIYVFIQLCLSRLDKKQQSIYCQIKPPIYQCLPLPALVIGVILGLIRLAGNAGSGITISNAWLYFNLVLISVVIFYALSRMACLSSAMSNKQLNVVEIKRHNRWFNPIGGT